MIGWLFGWLVGWLTGWFIDWLIGWLTAWLVGWLIGWLTAWLVVLFIYLFMYVLIDFFQFFSGYRLIKDVIAVDVLHDIDNGSKESDEFPHSSIQSMLWYYLH